MTEEKAAKNETKSTNPAAKGTMTAPGMPPTDASTHISQRIRELGDWRGEMLAQVRALIHEADPDVSEEWKWVKPASPGTPVWSHDGLVCTGESYQHVVKLTFAKGASLKDPEKLFNAGLEGNARRAIDLREGDQLDPRAFRALFREAVEFNQAHPPKRRRSSGRGSSGR